VEVWDELREQLNANPGLEAKTLFEALQRQYPGRFADGQLRAFQRRVRVDSGSLIHVNRKVYSVHSRLVDDTTDNCQNRLQRTQEAHRRFPRLFERAAWRANGVTREHCQPFHGRRRGLQPAGGRRGILIRSTQHFLLHSGASVVPHI